MRPRRHPCRYPGCHKKALRAEGFCSRSCARKWHLRFRLTAEQRSAQMRNAIRLRWQRDINRMIQRVKVLGETEEERLVLAWRYGKGSLKSERFRAKGRAARTPEQAA